MCCIPFGSLKSSRKPPRATPQSQTSPAIGFGRDEACGGSVHDRIAATRRVTSDAHDCRSLATPSHSGTAELARGLKRTSSRTNGAPKWLSIAAARSPFPLPPAHFRAPWPSRHPPPPSQCPALGSTRRRSACEPAAPRTRPARCSAPSTGPRVRGCRCCSALASIEPASSSCRAARISSASAARRGSSSPPAPR